MEPELRGGAEGVRRPPAHRARRLREGPGCRCSSTAPGSTRRRARPSPPTSPATGETIGEVPQGDRADARARSTPRLGRADGWARRDGVRARGRDAPRRRRGRAAPRRARPHADARPGQAAARRGARRGRGARRSTGATPPRTASGSRAGSPNSVSPGEARAARPPAARGDRRDHAVELAVHDAGRADRAGARAAATPSSGRRRRRRPSRPSRSPSASPRPTCRPASSTSSRARARSSATRSPATPARTASASSARPRPAARSPRRRPARRPCSSSAATGRSSCSTTPTSTPPPRRRSTACFLCAGQSCTAGERLLVHRDVRDEFVARLARARHASGSCSATRSPSGRRSGR